MNIPEQLKYSKSHEWVKTDGDTITMGISEFAISQLGDITLVELPEAGSTVTAGDSLGTIESVKAVSDLYSPVTGRVLKLNETLEETPENVNDDCYGKGWMLKIEVTASSDDLMDSTSYQEYLDSLD
jgi:glycine cleavage system H protein